MGWFLCFAHCSEKLHNNSWNFYFPARYLQSVTKFTFLPFYSKNSKLLHQMSKLSAPWVSWSLVAVGKPFKCVNWDAAGQHTYKMFLTHKLRTAPYDKLMIQALQNDHSKTAFSICYWNEVQFPPFFNFCLDNRGQTYCFNDSHLTGYKN